MMIFKMQFLFSKFAFAQLSPLPPASSEERKIELFSGDLALMFGIGLVALLILAFFAKQSFGQKKRRTAENRSVPKVARPLNDEGSKSRRRRRRRRTHRPSNPTLAETGGLPPREKSQSKGLHS